MSELNKNQSIAKLLFLIHDAEIELAQKDTMLQDAREEISQLKTDIRNLKNYICLLECGIDLFEPEQ